MELTVATTYSISELSKEFDVTTRTIRFYEEKGVLSPKRVGTRRIFSVADRLRLALILKGRRLGFSIEEARRTIHHIPTSALRIRAGGRTLGFSSDTAYDESLIAWLAEADLVVHETNLGVHTPYEKLAALPADLRAKMRLIHYTDFFDTENSAIEPLVQGRRYDV